MRRRDQRPPPTSRNPTRPTSSAASADRNAINTNAARKATPSQRPPGITANSLGRSEEHTSELQSLMRISYAVFCLKKKKRHYTHNEHTPKDTTRTKQTIYNNKTKTNTQT